MKVAIALAGYKGMEPLTHWCVSQLAGCPEPQFYESNYQPIAGPDVFRSLIATEAVEKLGSSDAVFFIDDDVVFDPKDVVKLANHIRDGKLIVGGAYVTKTSRPQITTRLFDDQVVEFKEDAKLVKVKYLAGGFMMVSMRVLKKLQEKVPYCNSKEDRAFWPFFCPFWKKVSGGILHKKQYEYLTEDYAFCDRVQDSGFTIWLDPSIRVDHIGKKQFKLEDITSVEIEPMSEIKVVKEGVL